MTKWNGLIHARKFSNMFRLIDDLSAINDGVEFEKVYQEVQIKSSDKKTSFLLLTKNCKKKVSAKSL